MTAMIMTNVKWLVVKFIDALADGPVSIIIIWILYSVYFGIKTQLLGESKGYDKGFLWGFFLGIFGWIIVKNKPEVKPEDTYIWENDSKEEADREQEILNKGGWKCNKCNVVNSAYVTTCVCGQSKIKNV